MAPMSVEKNKSNPFVHSKLSTAYEAFLFVALLLSNVFSISYFFRHYDMAYRNEFEKTFNCLQDCLGLSNALLNLSAFIFHRDRAIMIANKIYHIRQSAMLIDSSVYEKIPLSSRVLMIILVVFIFWSSMTTTVGMYGISYISKVTPIHISNLIIVAMILQYCAILKYLEKLFTFVNDKLSTDSKCLLVANTQIKPNTLDPVCRIYMSLKEVSRNLSEFYSPLMLLSILNIFLGFISPAYYIIKPFVFEKINKLPRLFVAHCLAFGIFHAVLLVALTKCVTATVYESKKTGEIVTTYFMFCKNVEVARKLDQFSSYLMLNKVEFTVYRLFSLDQSLLMSVIGSTTTYLVIILQLQDN